MRGTRRPARAVVSPCAIALAALDGTLAVDAGAAAILVPGDQPTIQAAIDASEDGDEVVMADGTYVGAGNVNLDYGGRAITVRSASGDPARCTIDCEAAPGTRGVAFTRGEGRDAVLEGVTIMRGDQTAGFPDDRGGAVLCDGASPTIRNCAFIDSTATFGGGGVFCVNGASPRLESCRLAGNTATRGGGLFCSGGNTRPELVACVFERNEGVDGGGANCFFGSRPTFDACTFTGNTSRAGDGRGGGGGGGGAMRCELQAAPELDGCTFTDNTAELDGGAIEMISASAPVIDDCTFTGNTALNGGGVCVFSAAPRITASRFRGNVAFFGAGAAIAADLSIDALLDGCLFEDNGDARTLFGGGLACRSSGVPTVRECTFRGNRSESGGGVASIEGSAPAIESCRFEANTARFGGGLAVDDASATVVNGLFDGNVADTFGGGVFAILAELDLINCTIATNAASMEGGGVHAISATPRLTSAIVSLNTPDAIAGPGGAAVTFSLVDGGWPGAGNIDGDARFARADCGSFELLPGSPCVDAGDDAAVPPGVRADHAGAPRVLDGNGDGVPAVDMGAFELDPDACRADLDGDGTVGFADLTTQLGRWGSTACDDAAADLDGSGAVGFVDLVLLLGAWGPCG